MMAAVKWLDHVGRRSGLLVRAILFGMLTLTRGLAVEDVYAVQIEDGAIVSLHGKITRVDQAGVEIGGDEKVMTCRWDDLLNLQLGDTAMLPEERNPVWVATADGGIFQARLVKLDENNLVVTTGFTRGNLTMPRELIRYLSFVGPLTQSAVESDTVQFRNGDTFEHMKKLVFQEGKLMVTSRNDQVIPMDPAALQAVEFAQAKTTENSVWLYFSNLGRLRCTPEKLAGGILTVQIAGESNEIHLHVLKSMSRYLPGEFEWKENTIGMPFCFCPSGSFTMGSPEEEGGRGRDEAQVKVSLREFLIGKTEVTQKQWQAVMKTSPSVHAAIMHPVEMVNWQDAMTFCTKLTGLEREAGRLPAGWVYRLPTEAEWEYACRAGTQSATSFGDTLTGDQANFNGYIPYGGGKQAGNRKKTMPVARLPANAWGIHDMHGNVWEWCLDAYNIKLPGGADPLVKQGKAKVLRGGGWNDRGANCRSANRLRLPPVIQDNYIGLRVVLVREIGD